MSHLFCHTCGTKLEYAHAKPNFCIKCGTQLGNTPVATARGALAPPQSQGVEEDETNAEYVPHIEKFQVETEASAHNTFTLGSLAGENTRPDFTPTQGSRSVDDFVDEKGE